MRRGLRMPVSCSLSQHSWKWLQLQLQFTRLRASGASGFRVPGDWGRLKKSYFLSSLSLWPKNNYRFIVLHEHGHYDLASRPNLSWRAFCPTFSVVVIDD